MIVPGDVVDIKSFCPTDSILLLRFALKPQYCPVNTHFICSRLKKKVWDILNEPLKDGRFGKKMLKYQEK